MLFVKLRPDSLVNRTVMESCFSPLRVNYQLVNISIYSFHRIIVIVGQWLWCNSLQSAFIFFYPQSKLFNSLNSYTHFIKEKICSLRQMNLGLTSVSLSLNLPLPLSQPHSPLLLPPLFPLLSIAQQGTWRKAFSFTENYGHVNWFNIFRVSITVYTFYASHLTSRNLILGNYLRYSQIFRPKDVCGNYYKWKILITQISNKKYLIYSTC